MRRLYNLDYLRGISAFGIMIYHYLFWTIGKFPANMFISRIGIYGVAIFYILSGLTLYHVYYHKLSPSLQEIVSFAKRRVFRLFPLLWLATIATVVLSRKKIPDLYDLLLNLTGLFGFIKWDTYFATGVWSIGNELVFYTFFPLFILLTKSFRPLMAILSVLIFAAYIYFSFFVLNSTVPLSDQWRNYINPLNQVFLFLSGFLIGLLFNTIKLSSIVIGVILGTALVLFVFYPAEGDAITLVTGTNRLIFTLCCCLICLGFYKASIKLPTAIHKLFTLLGETSYSIYLLHPIVYIVLSFVSKRIIHFPDPIKLILSVAATLIVSYFSYEYFEKYFIELNRSQKNKLA